MKTFSDLNGRSWAIDITVDSIDRIRSATNTNILGLFENQCELLARLMDDPVLMADVLWPIVEDQAETAKIDKTAFKKALAGDACEAAADGLVGAVIDFFPSKRRAVLSEVVAKLQRVMDTRLERMQSILADPAIDERLMTLGVSDLTSGIDSAGNLPASSASTRDR